MTKLHTSRNSRLGLTLMELILALGLTAVVMMAITTAISINLRAFNSRSSDVEEAQLARAVLRLIADDLRGAVEESATDFSGVEVASAEEMAGDALGELGIGDALFDTEEETTTTDDIADATELPPKMGLYGTATQLQVDVSRLPRPDQYFASMSSQDSAGFIEIPSDIKTVAYYLQAGDDTNLATAGLYGPTSTAGGMLESGLVRRSLDRSVTQYATDLGDTTVLMSAGEVVAPEVTSIQFAYFDGLEWLDEWDSTEMKALPVAVKVLISLKRSGSSSQQDALATQSSPGTIGENDMVFEQVIALPMAKPAPVEEDDLSELGL